MSFPSIILIILLETVIEPSVWFVAIAIGAFGWTQFGRLIYANGSSVSRKEYIESTRALGASDSDIIIK